MQPWQLKDLQPQGKAAYKVFSCYACAGGSSMGYKLAGFKTLGGVEIDPSMMKLYRFNLKPEYSFLMDIRDFNLIPSAELPKELLELDILDGSPPCSPFSIAGVREKKWGKAHKFKEGQKEQVLDDLFFHFLDTAAILKPKIIVAENVKGLITGKARFYVKQIAERFKSIGYKLQLFLLNAASMSVAQRRERTFFIARRDDLSLADLVLNFNEKIISTSQALRGIKVNIKDCASLSKETEDLWQRTKPGNSLALAHPSGSRFSEKKLDPNNPAPTLTTHTAPFHWNCARRITILEAARLQSFPDDYNFDNANGFHAIGMSVPPLMMKHIASEIKMQWLDNL